MNDDDDKPSPVDDEANEDDEENAENPQGYSNSKANDSWNVDKEWDREKSSEVSEWFLPLSECFMVKHSNQTVILCTWVLWKFDSSI